MTFMNFQLILDDRKHEHNNSKEDEERNHTNNTGDNDLDKNSLRIFDS